MCIYMYMLIFVYTCTLCTIAHVQIHAYNMYIHTYSMYMYSTYIHHVLKHMHVHIYMYMYMYNVVYMYVYF